MSSVSSAKPDAGADASSGTINGEMYIADGDYIKDIEVNDLRNRYILTKGSTQHEVNILLYDPLICPRSILLAPRTSCLLGMIARAATPLCHLLTPSPDLD